MSPQEVTQEIIISFYSNSEQTCSFALSHRHFVDGAGVEARPSAHKGCALPHPDVVCQLRSAFRCHACPKTLLVPAVGVLMALNPSQAIQGSLSGQE